VVKRKKNHYTIELSRVPLLMITNRPDVADGIETTMYKSGPVALLCN
jgi:hypothetical protein